MKRRQPYQYAVLCALAWVGCQEGSYRPSAAAPSSAMPAPDGRPVGTVVTASIVEAGPLDAAAHAGAQGPEQLYLQAVTLLAQDRASDAIGLLEHCIVLDRTFARCYRALGLAYSERGATDIAVAYYEKYLTLVPDAVDAPVVRHMIQSVLQATQGVRQASE